MNAEKPSEALLTKHIVFPFRGTEQEKKKKKEGRNCSSKNGKHIFISSSD